MLKLICMCQVLQRKTEEASMATKRLKELLESRKAASREGFGEIKFTSIILYTPIIYQSSNMGSILLLF